MAASDPIAILDHVGVNVADFDRSHAFYVAALAPLGIVPIMAVTAEETGGPRHCGFGRGVKPAFWIGDVHPAGNAPADGGARPSGVHVAFAADDHAAVDAFYAAAMAAGGRDNGPPGLRPHYHPGYYGAFVLDPDGHNVEAVCHRPA